MYVSVLVATVMYNIPPADLPTPGPGDYNLQELASVGKEAPKPSLHARLYPLSCKQAQYVII